MGNKNPDETSQEGFLDWSLKFWALRTSLTPEPSCGFSPKSQNKRGKDFKHPCYPRQQNASSDWFPQASSQEGWLSSVNFYRKGLQPSWCTCQKRYFITTSITHPISSEWEVSRYLVLHAARCWALSFAARQEQTLITHRQHTTP